MTAIATASHPTTATAASSWGQAGHHDAERNGSEATSVNTRSLALLTAPRVGGEIMRLCLPAGWPC
jgi:hypothetical protein